VSEHARVDRFDVVVVGSLNVDLVVRAERHPRPGETISGSDYHEFPGGKGLNQAVAAARCGASVAMVGAVGDDAAGEGLREIVRAEGVDDRWLATIAGLATGRALITVDHAGENSIVVVPGANARATWPADGPIASVVLGQLEIPLETISDAFTDARAHASTTILNPAPAVPLGQGILSTCSMIVPNEHEADLLGGPEALRSRGVDTIITTRGARGLRLDDASGSRSLPSYRVTSIDTTGAGDAFCGNLAARLAAGDELSDAARWASAAGALATTALGAVPSLPRSEAVAELLAADGDQSSRRSSLRY
jgi:ribokinase